MLHKIPLNGDWVSGDDAWLKANFSEGAIATLLHREHEAYINPVAHFIPHGVSWSDKTRKIADGKLLWYPSQYPERYGNDGVGILNDHTSDICLWTGPNQTGKTYLAAAWSILRIIPTKASWPIFDETNVEYHEWDGPKIWIAASYSWDNVGTVWKRYQELLPRDELGPYAMDWGKYPQDVGRKKEMSFRDFKTKSLTLKCGSVIKFLSYTQQQIHWEGFDADGAHLDEQAPIEKMIGLQRAFTTRGDYTPIIMSLTGHVLEDRPDTGASGWIKPTLFDPTQINETRMAVTRFGTVSSYQLSIDCVPMAILTKKRRKKLYDSWVNPKMSRSRKDERAAIARYWGGWEEGSGLLFDSDVWQRKVHIINPLWDDDKTPDFLTKWRVIDYGPKAGVNVCAWFAVGPKRAVMYRLLYERGVEIAEFAKMIIEASHNRQILDEERRHDVTGSIHQYYHEEQCKEVFWGGTLLDSRSMAQSLQGETLEEVFNRYGLHDIRKACGQNDDIQIPRLKDWLRIDYSVQHPWRKDENGEPEMGCPKLFVFDGRCEDFVNEISTLGKAKAEAAGIMDKKAPSHSIDAAKYWASDNPVYMGDVEKENQEEDTESHTPVTGY